MKMTNDRAAFYGILGETIDIYQAEHAVVAAYHELGGRTAVPGRKYRIVVGHDQSPASDMMEAAVCAALCAAGADVLTLGAVPSGAVSYLTAKADALMGVMITGNSFDTEVSGLKFYHSNGRPVLGEQLQSILASIDSHAALSSKQSGRIVKADGSVLQKYRANLLEASNYTMFETLKVAVDCTQSASAVFVRDLFEQLGAEVSVFAPDPSEEKQILPAYSNPAALIDYVRDTKSDIGFAFSASGENCLVADAEGKLYDTEKLAAIFGFVYGTFASRGAEAQTVMVSDSCHIALAPYIQSVGAQCRVVTGDYSYLAEEFLNYGAASSANDGVMMAADRDAGLVFPRRSYVPDGLMTAVMLLTCMNRMGMSMAELSVGVPRLIRNTSSVNIPSGAVLPLLHSTDLNEEIHVLRSYLSGDGRVSIYRADSGRGRVEIIVEGIKPQQVAKVAEMAERLVRKNLREKDGVPIREQEPYRKNEDKPADYEDAVQNYVDEAKERKSV